MWSSGWSRTPTCQESVNGEIRHAGGQPAVPVKPLWPVSVRVSQLRTYSQIQGQRDRETGKEREPQHHSGTNDAGHGLRTSCWTGHCFTCRVTSQTELVKHSPALLSCFSLMNASSGCHQDSSLGKAPALLRAHLCFMPWHHKGRLQAKLCCCVPPCLLLSLCPSHCLWKRWASVC